MAEADEVTEQPASQDAATEESQEQGQEPEQQAEEVTEQEPEREPGGDDPQVVYARRQYREAKKLREEKQQWEVERARYEERLRLLEESKKQAAAQPKDELTIEKVEAAIREGTIDQALGLRWIARKEAEMLFQAEQKKLEAKQTITKAQAEVAEYMKVVPNMRDTSSKEYQAVQAEYDRLIAEDGFQPDDPRTYRAAFKLAHGPLEKFRAKSEVDRMTRESFKPHNATPSGGAAVGGKKGIDITKAPADLKAFWERAQTPEGDRLKEYQYFLNRQTRRAAVAR